MSYSVVIYGDVPSKPNSYKIGKRNGTACLYKSKGVKSYEDIFAWQIKRLKEPITATFELLIDCYMINAKKDADNTLKVVLDCLQRNDIIKNDSQCYRIVYNKHIDKLNPRIELTINIIKL